MIEYSTRLVARSCGLFFAGFVAVTLAVCVDGQGMPLLVWTIPAVFWQHLALFGHRDTMEARERKRGAKKDGKWF